jgi:hypothetical protein
VKGNRSKEKTVYPGGVDRVVGVVVCGRRVGDGVSESRDAS